MCAYRTPITLEQRRRRQRFWEHFRQLSLLVAARFRIPDRHDSRGVAISENILDTAEVERRVDIKRAAIYKRIRSANFPL